MSRFWARIVLTVVDGSHSGLSSVSLGTNTLRAWFSLRATVCTKIGGVSEELIAYSGRSSSRGLSSSPVVYHRDCALAAWCFRPAQCTMSKSNTEGFKRHRSRLKIVESLEGVVIGGYWIIVSFKVWAE